MEEAFFGHFSLFNNTNVENYQDSGIKRLFVLLLILEYETIDGMF
jgi:hypothetical protein